MSAYIEQTNGGYMVTGRELTGRYEFFSLLQAVSFARKAGYKPVIIGEV